MTAEHHIIHADCQAREDYAVRQIAENPLLLAAVTEPMGLGCFSWYVLGMDTQWTGRKPGDIDILGGKLAWRDPRGLVAAFVQMQERYPDWHPSWHADLAGRSLAQEGGIAWPPSREFLSGVEVKCSYVIGGVAGSTKASRQKVDGIRGQIDGLLALGLDRVALLNVIATTPADGQEMHAWFGAANNARTAFATMSDIKNVGCGTSAKRLWSFSLSVARVRWVRSRCSSAAKHAGQYTGPLRVVQTHRRSGEGALHAGNTLPAPEGVESVLLGVRLQSQRKSTG